MKNLKPQQERFVVEYLKTPENATDAAIRAGYSPKTATAQASRLLTNVNVKKAIDEAQSETRERVKEGVGLTIDMVVQGLLKEARDYADGSTQSARVSAWAHLGKHLGMFKDNVVHSGPNGGAIKTENIHVPVLPQYTPEELAEMSPQELSRLAITGKL